MRIRVHRSALLLTTALAALSVRPAAAQTSTAQLSSIEKQIQLLQEELRRVKHELADRDHEGRGRSARPMQPSATAPGALPEIPPGYALVPATPGTAPGTVVLAKTVPAEPPSPPGTFRIGGVQISLIGSYIEGAGIFRTRNEVTDLTSSFNTGIPLPISPTYHESEFRGTARGSRIALGATAKIDDVSRVSGYVESDFLAGAPTANSNQTNSYTPRLRQAFADYKRSDWNLDVLAGQTYTLLTQSKLGISPRSENIPLTIDSNMVVGFTYVRQAQIRVAKDFDDHKLWLAASLESPQTVFYTGPNGGAPAASGTLNLSNTGTGNNAATVSYSSDVAPDVVVKAAYDPPSAHVEAYGIMRFMHDRTSYLNVGRNYTTLGGGGGLAGRVSVVPNVIDLQASFLAGEGIGRYGPAQFPDATVGRNGSPSPLPEVQALAGIVAHPIKPVDIYAYIGTEQVGRKWFAASGKEYGYGAPLYPNAGCNVEISTAACTANTSGVVQGVIGAWWRVTEGDWGRVQTGLQYSYTRRSIFSGTGPTPGTDENIIFLSLRYYPFK